MAAEGLPWVRMDTNIAGNDKISDLIDEHGQRGKAAAAVYLFAIGYAGQHGTSGVIKKSQLKFIHGTPGDVGLLVGAEMFDQIDGGWQIHNYGKRNLVGFAQQAISTERAAAGRKGAEKRWSDDG
jgi:hypothetical protein